jgi:aldose 1-epimerase
MARAAAPPSGEQIELRYGDQLAVVVEVGGALRRYVAGGADMLDGYGEHEMCSGGRGQSLLPWPNRLRDGSYEFAGRRYQLPLTEPANGNAIHGLVRWLNWTVAARADDRVVMAHQLHPQPGYPFALALELEYVLSDQGLRIQTTATNVGEEPCPYGAGAHPYLKAGVGGIDSCTLRAPASLWMPSDQRGIPTGTEPVTGTPYDFRSARPIGQTQLDTCYCGLEADGDGLARIVLQASEGDHGITLWMDGAYRYLMLFTGDSLAPERRRRGVAVEPMTCAPNAFQTGEGLRVLGPEERFTSTWGIQPGAR